MNSEIRQQAIALGFHPNPTYRKARATVYASEIDLLLPHSRIFTIIAQGRS
ncbi:MAG: hypothetical protein IGR76_11800 [Synechococcales cyanobacterium T60_A2020_003]|nr:hypothetical protein [Synechococcales cyanobacterium T60_A2020_003]